MAFTFQINDDKFNHNEELLAKAQANRPEMFENTIDQYELAVLEKDPSKLEGWRMAVRNEKLSGLSFRKGESFIIDFKDHYVGNFSIDVDSVGSPMDAPLHLQLRFAEVPAELSYKSSDYNGWISSSWIQEEFIHIDELPVRLELPRRYACRYVEITTLDTSPKWAAVFSNPVMKAAASADYSKLKPVRFKDKMLQKIHDTSIKTLADCMSDVFEDGPKRDRRLWIGDLRLQALANYSTFQNQELVKRCLYLFGGMNTEEGKISANVFVKPKNVPDDTFLFDYSLFFINILNDYLNRFEDEETLKDLFPVARDQMDLSLTYLQDNGQLVLEEKYPVFIDWSNDFNKDTAGQAVLIYALKAFIELCKKAGMDASRYEEALKKAEEYALNELYNKEKHMFRTGMEEYNIASQAWMVLADVLPAEENKKVMEAAIQELFPIIGIATPYMYHHIADALFKAGLEKEAVDFMKGYWGKMIELGADTYWEAFDPNRPDYSPYDSPIISSYCHAWSCTPVYLMDKYLGDEYREN